jgi:hypothetical protein
MDAKYLLLYMRLFIRSLSAAALLHRKPFSAGQAVTAAVVKEMIKIHAV